MIYKIIWIILVQRCWLVSCDCNHTAVKLNRLSYLRSNCVFENLTNSNILLHDADLPKDLNRKAYNWNTITLNLQNGVLNNFSAGDLIAEGIACNYGKINLLLNDMHINRINVFPSEVTTKSQSKCNVSYTSIQFTNNNITELNGQTFHHLVNLTSINLSNNNIKTLDKLMFNKLKSLKTLNLSNNKLSKLDNIFGNLERLDYLNISINDITTIPKGVFVNMTYLRHLNASYNQITNIASGAFIYLNNLMYLDISHNRLTTIDMGSFSGLHKLRNMNIGYNYVKPNKYLMINTPSLIELDISFNELENLDVDLFSLQHLTSINIDGNKFSCQLLIHYINKFKQFRTKLQFGTEKDRSSLHGIHCNDTESNEDITINLESDSTKSYDVEMLINQRFNDTLTLMEESSNNIANAFNSTMIQMIQLLIQTQVQGEDKDSLQKSDSELDFQSLILNVQEIANVLIVIACFMVLVAVGVVVCCLWNKTWRSLRNNVHLSSVNSEISRSELCSLTDSL